MGAAATGVLVPVGVSSWKSTFLQRKFSKTWGKHCRWINSFCFFCSAGRVEPSPGSKLRFQPPGKFRCSAVFFDSLVYIQLSRSGWPWGLIVFVGIVLKRFGFFALGSLNLAPVRLLPCGTPLVWSAFKGSWSESFWSKFCRADWISFWMV